MLNPKPLVMHPVEEAIDGLFLVASLTPRKVEEYAAIISYIGKQTGKRYVVRALNDFEDFHSPVEDANTLDQNLAKKEAEAARTVMRLREGGTSHKQFVKRLKESGIIFKGGIETAMKRSVVMVDDTTTAIPKDIWQAMLPELQRLVVPDSLKISDCPIKGIDDPYVCVADIGPITSSVGQEAFWRLVAETADKLPRYKGKPIKVYDQVKCSFRRVGAPDGAPFESVTAQKPLYVFRAPDGYKPKEIVARSDHFQYCPSAPHTPLYEDLERYLLEESMRRDIASGMLKVIAPRLDALPAHLPTEEFFSPAASQAIGKPRKLRAAVFVPKGTEIDAQAYGLENYDVRPIYLPVSNEETLEDLNDNERLDLALSMDFSFEHADILFFPPHDASNPVLHCYYNLLIRSAHVAKSLDACYHHSPLLILNKDGCYEDIIASHIAGAESGFNKEMVLHPVHLGLTTGEQITCDPSVDHTPLVYTDLIEVNGAPIDNAIREILNFRLKNFRPITPAKPRPPDAGGNKGDEDHFAATVFASASSDKKIDWDNAYAIGKFLANHRLRLCTGGGDQHLMYAAVQGYEDVRAKKAFKPGETHLTCVSTHDIVYVETVGGEMPHSDYWELHQTIGPRLETLMQSHLLISVGGGDGTEQEIAYAMLKMKYLPQNSDAPVQQKSLLFVGEDPAMLAGIRCIVGEEDFKKLQKNRYALADKNIFLARNAKEAETVILMAKNGFYSRNASTHRKAPASQPPAPYPR